MPSEARELVLDMLQVSPCDRLSLKELCASPWVVRSGLLPQEAPADVEAGGMCEACDDDDPKVHGRGVGAIRTHRAWRGAWRVAQCACD